MTTTGAHAPDDRPAPGALALVQELLNTSITEPTDDDVRVATAVRMAHAAGESQAALAARFGVSQQLVSAILRGKRVIALDEDGQPVAAPTLGSSRGAAKWLRDHGFAASATDISPGQHERLLRLREALLGLCLANNGEPLDARAVATVNVLAAETPLLVKLSRDDDPQLVPRGSGVDAFIASAIAVVYDAMRDRTWSRLKACPGERCRHVFYDTSRNRTSTWCSMAVCGNRSKVRRYQERARAARR